VPVIVALVLGMVFAPAPHVQVALEAAGELSLSAATTRGVQVDGIFGPTLRASIPVRGAYWLSLTLGGRAGTLGGRSDGATQTVSASSRDGVIDLRLLAHVPLALRRDLELRVGPLAGVAVQIARSEVWVGARTERTSAFVGLEAGAQLALVWRRLLFSFDGYGVFTPATLPPRFVLSIGVGFVVY
jgi:hypothetical protein